MGGLRLRCGLLIEEAATTGGGAGRVDATPVEAVAALLLLPLLVASNVIVTSS